MLRREFITKTSILSCAAILKQNSVFNQPNFEIKKSRVVLCHEPQIQNTKNNISTNRLLKTLDNGMQNLFDVDNPIEAWRKIVSPGEVIGIKVNCLSGLGSTHVQLVYAVIERLLEAGIKQKDIIVWDRLNSDLEDGGFKIQDERNKERYIGNDILGFEGKLHIFGEAASLVCKTVTKECDAIINLPLFKDHSIAGLTMSLKNMFGAIHNPNKYHLNTGDPYIADVNMLNPIRNKVRLHICDAIDAQYEGGPSFMPHWRWQMNSLLLSTDPVALDYTGWQIIDSKRREKGLKTLKEVGREPKYIATAADKNHGLGTNDPDKIDLVKV